MITGAAKRTLISALEEDLGSGDLTSEAIFREGLPVVAEVIVKDERLRARGGVLAGLEEALFLLDHVGGITIEEVKEDGGRIAWGERVLSLSGEVKKILAVERTILNILGRMSGIATLTRWLQEDHGVRVAATRKSPPGLLSLDKKAVELGGGYPHRRGLYEKILIKDNHLSALM
ncbi:MAG: nicotinate-nucleotide diphosphorylase, partial [Candidatus Bipolaricaulia bacterium]